MPTAVDKDLLMLRRQPRTAMVTTTLLAAVSAAPAWADCEALRQQLVGQYGVMLKYEQGAEATAQRCRQLNAPLVPDQAALAQCNANYQMFSNAVVQADTTYLQLYNNYSAVCTTTATYGPNSAPAYAQDAIPSSPDMSSPYANQPSATIPTPTVVTPSDFGTQGDAQAINNFIGVLGGVGLGGRGRGRSFKSGDC